MHVSPLKRGVNTGPAIPPNSCYNQAMNRKVSVFIDASNLWQAMKAKGFTLDMAKLFEYLKERYKTTELEVYYYTAYPADDTRDYNLDSLHKFHTYLKKALGVNVRKKALKQIKLDKVNDKGYAFEEKGNMDVELAIDAVHYLKTYDTAVMFSGDSDFLGLVKFLRARGKKIYVFSTRNNISSEMRTGADGYIDILGITEDIWRNPIHYRDQGTSSET